MKMEINFGSRYADLDNNVYKCIGSATSFNKEDKEIILLAPIHAGTVGDVIYMSRSKAEKDGIIFPVSRFY